MAVDNAIEHQRSTVGLGFWHPFRAVFTNRRTTYRFLLGGSLFMWQNACGINAINYYSPTVFKSIGVRGTNTSLLTTGIFGVIKTVLTLVWLFFLIDKLGRRTLLIWGAFLGGLCMWYIGGYIAVADPSSKVDQNSGMSGGGISAMFFFYLWTAIYSPSWNGTPWVLNSEMFDQGVRTLAQAFAAANNWFWVSFALSPAFVKIRPFPAKDVESQRSNTNEWVVTEFHRRSIHPANVRQHVIRRLLFLCIPHAHRLGLCLFPRTRDQRCPS